ncbi:MAG: hypothetical protein COU11_00540 [Candidatus Harrisonbacteria bacterium CG10_big_fil_rev_8_21_14_0_10_49_15]|uniref:Uncharacterized protein n=1 Tax=Candidatus Harrisonbacteria bacterium CG10_big_fil_rev_8_21_14_0_10_49_15 TaxID=1974587 RepID=A0A2H0ULY8_9BACT|nr:MAG: hypothetical protein COU11_00540 [Candidatus Harrisonbacteria bacterium CG10_big_fil_rev_8_21_14_0_10_49_15]
MMRQRIASVLVVIFFLLFIFASVMWAITELRGGLIDNIWSRIVGACSLLFIIGAGLAKKYNSH